MATLSEHEESPGEITVTVRVPPSYAQKRVRLVFEGAAAGPVTAPVPAPPPSLLEWLGIDEPLPAPITVLSPLRLKRPRDAVEEDAAAKMSRPTLFDAAIDRAWLQQQFTPHTNQLNAHPRDARIRTVFTDKLHDYYIDGIKRTSKDHWYSPSGLMHHLWKPFDAERIAKQCAKSSRNPRYKGKTWQQILAIWEEGKVDGQNKHAAEDAWLQHEPYPGTDEPPPGFFRAMAELAHRGYDVFRTEMSLFDDELQIMGQTDLLLRHRETGIITVADHKHCRVESLVTPGRNGSGIHPWSEHMADARLEHYHFQLSVYHLLLKRGWQSWPLSDEIILINYSPLDENAYEIVPRKVLDLTSDFVQYLPWNTAAALHQHFSGPTLRPRATNTVVAAGPTQRVRLPGAPLAPDMVWIGHAWAKGGLPESPWAHPWRWYPRAPYTAPGFYERHLLQNAQLLQRLPELVGKRIVCWCKDDSEQCACVVLVKYANLLAAGEWDCHIKTAEAPMSPLFLDES
jgi:hypothetical protein